MAALLRFAALYCERGTTAQVWDVRAMRRIVGRSFSPGFMLERKGWPQTPNNRHSLAEHLEATGYGILAL